MRILRSVKPAAVLVGLLGGAVLWILAWGSPAALTAEFGARVALGLSSIPVLVPDPWSNVAYWLTMVRPGDIAAFIGMAVLCTSLAQCALVLASLFQLPSDPSISADPSRAVVVGQASNHSGSLPSGHKKT